MPSALAVDFTLWLLSFMLQAALLGMTMYGVRASLSCLLDPGGERGSDCCCGRSSYCAQTWRTTS